MAEDSPKYPDGIFSSAKTLADFLKTVRKPSSAKNPYAGDKKKPFDTKNLYEVDYEFAREYNLYDEDYEAIREQIEPLQWSLEDDGFPASVDSKKIVESGRKVLAQKWKDLRIACWLTQGLTRLDGMAGMAEGMTVIRTLVDAFGENLHPKAPEGREETLAFLQDDLKILLVGRTYEEEEQVPIEKALENLKTLGEHFSKELDVPVWDDLHAVLEGALHQIGASIRVSKTTAPAVSKATEPETDQSALEQGTEPAASTPAKTEGQAPRPDEHTGVVATRVSAPGPGQNGHEPLRAPTHYTYEVAYKDQPTARNAIDGIVQEVTNLRIQDPKNPVPYRLLRTLRWGNLTRPSPENEADPRTTSIIAPPSTDRGRFKPGGKLSEETFILEAEVSFGEPPYHLWLDLQRLVVEHLDTMGASYDPAKEVILEEFAVLIHRYPWLPLLQFKDETPFADDKTQYFIKVRVLPRVNGMAGAASTDAAGSGAHRWEELFHKASARLPTDGLVDALTVLKEPEGVDATEQDRFLQRWYLAKLLIEGGHRKIACPVLESLDEDIARHALETWDPDLALNVWQDLYTCYTALAEEEDEPDKPALRLGARRILSKLSRLEAWQPPSAFRE